MTIVVESGNGNNPAANSYVSLAEGRALAAAMGLSLPADNTEAETALLGAMGYLEGFRLQYQGHASNSYEQPLSWPRRLAFIEGFELPDDIIPQLLKQAQAAAASEIGIGTELFPSAQQSNVKRKAISVIETEYFAPNKSESYIPFPRIEMHLKPLLVQSSKYNLF